MTLFILSSVFSFKFGRTYLCHNVALDDTCVGNYKKKDKSQGSLTSFCVPVFAAISLKVAWSGESLKWGFHEPTNHADERHKTDNLWNFEKIFSQCHRFVKTAD